MEFIIIVVMWLLRGVVIFGGLCLNLAMFYWMFGSNPETDIDLAQHYFKKGLLFMIPALLLLSVCFWYF